MLFRPSTFRTLPVVIAGLLALTAGCGDSSDDEGGNQLPSTGGDGDGDGDGDASGCATDNQAVGTEFPATFRFSCIDIQVVGSADDDSLQAGLLQSAWDSDIENFKLNILADVVQFDRDAGTGTMQVRSGIGTSCDDMCSEPQSDSPEVSVSFDSTINAWGPTDAEDACAAPGAGAPSGEGGTFQLNFGVDEVLYIYAEDDDGTSFNCTEDTATPDAVPLRAITAEFTLDESGQFAYGSLNGCMLESEAQNICSCLGQCNPQPEPFAECQSCNPDSVPLRELLLGVTTTQNCTDILGAPAFDMQVAFSAARMADMPARCGG